MTHHRRSIIALLAGLTLFFNLERVDFGQVNAIDISSFVYVIGFFAVLSVITLPALARAPFTVSLAVWVGVYLLCKLTVFNRYPLFGGIHTYLSVTEVALLSMLIWLAHNLGRNLYDFEEAVKNITFSDVSRQIRNLDAAAEDIQLEFIRSRRHQRPLSVIVVQTQPESVHANLHRAVEEVQRKMMTRYVVTSLARVIGGQLRRMDLMLDQREQGRYIILSPETDAANAKVVVERIQAAAIEELGVSVLCSVAAFPEDALTFEDLVHQAELYLQGSAESAQFSTPPPAPAEFVR